MSAGLCCEIDQCLQIKYKIHPNPEFSLLYVLFGTDTIWRNRAKQHTGSWRSWSDLFTSIRVVFKYHFSNLEIHLAIKLFVFIISFWLQMVFFLISCNYHNRKEHKDDTDSKKTIYYIMSWPYILHVGWTNIATSYW